jgi:cbb3-type cytochrome oxidase maturation protein
MNILLVLIPVTLLVIVIAVALFFWAVNHQQFDDLESPAVLPLMDDPPPGPAQSNEPAPANATLATQANEPDDDALDAPEQNIAGSRDPDQG